MSEKENVFNQLAGVNVDDRVKEKGNLKYLSWANAWTEVKKKFPDAIYEIKTFATEPTGIIRQPYFYDKALGYMVQTEVTIDGTTLPMVLPVMDNNNKAMKDHPYQYTVLQWDNVTRTRKEFTKTVDAASMFDINKAIMRCLVKNIAMFGLGLYVYNGEDFSEDVDEETGEVKNAETKVVVESKTEATKATVNKSAKAVKPNEEKATAKPKLTIKK